MINILQDSDVLSIQEEKILTQEEYEEYIQNLRKYCVKRKLKRKTPGAVLIAPKLKFLVNKIASVVTNIICQGQVEIEIDGLENYCLLHNMIQD